MALKKEITNRIRELLRQHPNGLNITAIVRQIEINRNTAGRYLENLMVSGQVEMRHYGMAKIYRLAQRVPLSAMLSISSELIMLLDNSRRVLYANEPMLRFLGTTQKDLYGKTIEYTTCVTAFGDAFDLLKKKAQNGIAGKEWSGDIVVQSRALVFACRIAPAVFDEGQRGVSLLLEDVTRRRRAEEALRESEDRYRTLVEITPDAILLHRDGKIIFMNPAALTMFGVKDPDTIVGKKVIDIIHPQFRDMVLASIAKDLAGEITQPLELPLIRPDGTQILVEGRGVKAMVGGSPAVQVVLRDITKRKQDEEALRESEGKLSAMLQSISDPMSMMDQDLTIKWANEAAIRYFGNDIVGRKCYEAYHQRQKPCEPYPCLTLKAFRDGKIHSHETSVIDKNGEERFFVCTANVALRDKSGKPVAALEISRDITQRKKAEQKLSESEKTARALLNAPTDSILLLDRSGVILEVNDTAVQKLGKKKEDLIGVCADTVFPDDIAHSRRLKISQVLETKQAVRFVDQREGIWFDTVAYPIINETGEVIRIAIIARDISELKHSEEALRETVRTFRMLANKSTDIIARIAPDGTCIYVSSAVKQSLGYEPEEVTGRSAFDYLHKDDLNRGKKTIRVIMETGSDMGTDTFSLRHKDGHYVRFGVSIRVIRDRETGKVREFYITSREIRSRETS